MDQIIVAIGRENGSGGRDIANRIAGRMDVSMYDVRILKDIAKAMNSELDPGDLAQFEEAPRRSFGSRRVKGHSNSIEEIVAEKQFEYIKKLADTGESFVVVGRCADYILREYKGLVKIFIIADEDKKRSRIAIRYNVDEDEAVKLMKKTDKGRKAYYEKYAKGYKWKDPNAYDIIVNSSRLGIDETADMLYDFIMEFKQQIYS